MSVRFRDWDCHVLMERYQTGGMALRLFDAADGSSVARATVNVPGAALAENQILIKDYAENAGILEALEAAGLVEDTGLRAPTGHARAHVVRVSEALMAQWRQLQPPGRERGR